MVCRYMKMNIIQRTIPDYIKGKTEPQQTYNSGCNQCWYNNDGILIDFA